MGSQSILAALLLGFAACQSASKPVDPLQLGTAEQPQSGPQGPVLQDLRDLTLEGADLNAALYAMDQASAAFEREPEFWQIYGRTSLDYAAQELNLGRMDSLEIMYNDAEYAFGKLRELDPDRSAGYFGHGYSLRMLGDFEAAWQCAEAALLWGQSTEMPLALREEIGRAGLALVIESIQAGQSVPAAAEIAEAQLTMCVAGSLRSSVLPLSDLLAWQGRSTAAKDVLIEALLANPDHAEAIDRLKSLAPGTALADAWQRISRSHPDNPLVQWRLGEALWTSYWAHRNQTDFTKAHEALNRAEESFLNAMALEASYQATCQEWLHLIHTAQGWVYWLEASVDDAAAAFLAALEADPARLEAEATAESLKLGIYSVEGYYFQQMRLDKVRSFHSRLFKTYSDNPDWTNNYAFACRDLGVNKAEQGFAEEATALFQESWMAYGRTVELAPTDARLVNDHALISVYYLDEHWDEAEQELHRAIRLGDKQLAEMAADVPAKERRNLDEAVGDAWENLAYLDVIRRKQTDRADAFLAESLKHFPFDNRDGVRRIRQTLDQLRSESPQ